MTGVLAYRDGRPAATALVFHHGRAAGIYWVGTTASAQRLGLGGLCTALATNAGFDAGAQVLGLQATAFGEPVYRRLGFRTYDRVRTYRTPRPGA